MYLTIVRISQDLRIASICGVFLIILIRYLHLHKCLCVSPDVVKINGALLRNVTFYSSTVFCGKCLTHPIGLTQVLPWLKKMLGFVPQPSLRYLKFLPLTVNV